MTASKSGVVPANGMQIAFEAFGDLGNRPLLWWAIMNPPSRPLPCSVTR